MTDFVKLERKEQAWAAAYLRFYVAMEKAAKSVGALVVGDEITFAGPSQHEAFKRELANLVDGDTELQGLLGGSEASS